MLRDLELKRKYRSGTDDFVRDFFAPCLGCARRYDRAVGFYSSGALSTAADGLAEFVEGGGMMRLVASPHLGERDLGAIVAGYRRRDEEITRTVTAALTVAYPDAAVERLAVLGRLVAEGRLEIKLAVVKREDGTGGIYHEKLGMFEDGAGDRVAFFGSANESKGGMRSNFESFMVFRSWVEAEAADLGSIGTDVEDLWADRTPNLAVFAFPDAAAEALVRAGGPGARRPQAPPPPPSEPSPPTPPPPTAPPPTPPEPTIPSQLELRDYQHQAILAWLRNDARGILEMATGTGKTYTALAAATRLQQHRGEAGKAVLCVVVCPYQHLVRQWADAVREFGVEPVLCYRSADRWRGALAERIHALKSGTAKFALAIATNSTFTAGPFGAMAAEFPRHTLLIADEAHNLGSPKGREALTDSYRYRLALSATPERAYDEEGTDFVESYFGGTVFSYGLEAAIESGALTPYDYFPHVVELEDEELDAYLELTAKIAKLSHSNDEAIVEGPLLALLIKRARIIAGARGKLSALAEAVRPLVDTTHNLFYCGDGTIDAGEVTAERQLDAVVRLLGSNLGMAVQSYTHENFAEERDVLRERFGAGDLQGLVAIRCLDEGVDIPETRRAFILASSTNPRQFVQRRGRVLRRAPGKDSAEIHDFLVLPPAGSVEAGLWETERRLVERELNRIALFAQLARNGLQALHSLAEVRERYELLHIG
jgi:DNA phosphorothioation system restriction enzyme